MTIAALCGFLGNIEGNDPDGAAEALRAAGYQVFRLPPELKAATCEIEGDDFIEVRREGDADDDAINAMWADAQRIVAPFKGMSTVSGLRSKSCSRTDLATAPSLLPLQKAWNAGRALVVDQRRPISRVVPQRLSGGVVRRAGVRYAGPGTAVAR